MDKAMKEAIKFFAEHAGYATPPGRMACAKALAKAEAQAELMNLRVEWESDYDADDSWMDAKQRKDFEDGKLIPMVCRMFNADKSQVLAALGGIFLYENEDAGTYQRVVEAELAQEAIQEIESGKATHCEECGAETA